MSLKFYKLLSLTALITIFFTIFTQSAFAVYSYEKYYSDSWNNPVKGTIVSFFSTETQKFISSTTFKHSFWLPARWLFKSHVNNVDWDNTEKIAYLKNNEQELVFNFSGKDLNLKTNQILVPDTHTKIIDGKTYIDGLWLGWLFDANAAYAPDGDDPNRLKLEKELSFLNISATNMPFDTRDRQNMFQLAIYFNNN